LIGVLSLDKRRICVAAPQIAGRFVDALRSKILQEVPIMVERKTSQERAKTNPTSGSAPDLLFNINQHAFQCWARGISALTEQMGQFVQARLREDIGTWSKLTACRDAGQLLECQRQYMEQSATDYLDEVGKLSDLTLEIASDAFSALHANAGGTARSSEMASA
jgi:Phasin protein